MIIRFASTLIIAVDAFSDIETFQPTQPVTALQIIRSRSSLQCCPPTPSPTPSPSMANQSIHPLKLGIIHACHPHVLPSHTQPTSVASSSPPARGSQPPRWQPRLRAMGRWDNLLRAIRRKLAKSSCRGIDVAGGIDVAAGDVESCGEEAGQAHAFPDGCSVLMGKNSAHGGAGSPPRGSSNASLKGVLTPEDMAAVRIQAAYRGHLVCYFRSLFVGVRIWERT